MGAATNFLYSNFTSFLFKQVTWIGFTLCLCFILEHKNLQHFTNVNNVSGTQPGLHKLCGNCTFFPLFEYFKCTNDYV